MALINPKQEARTTLKQNLRRNIIFSVAIPLLIFYGFKQFNMLLTGIELASGWSIAVIVISLVKLDFDTWHLRNPATPTVSGHRKETYHYKFS